MIAESTDILVPTLGVSYKNISQSLSALSALGIVSLEMVTKDRGRPVKAFRIESDGILDYFQVDDLACQKLIHQPLIDSLLCWGEYDEDACSDLGQGLNTRSRRTYLQDEIHTLDGKSRMLLAVLLAHADEFGFVESIGQAEIESMTSFNSDQRGRLVKSLLNNNYIRSVIKGFTCSHIFGRVETLYCLNTCKGNISGQPAYRISITHSSLAHQANEHSEAFQLWHLANQLRKCIKSTQSDRYVWVRSLIDHNHLLVDLRHFPIDAFSVFNDSSLVDYLQYRLETYATWFLEAPGFNGDESEKMDEQWERVLNKIKHDAFPESRDADEQCGQIFDPSSSSESKNNVARILAQIAWSIAKKYHQYLSRFAPAVLASEKRRLRVFPRLYKTPRFESLAFSMASLVMHKPDDHAVAEFVHLRDDRGAIQRALEELSNRRMRGVLSDSDFRAQLSALESRPQFTEVRCHNEEDLDEMLRRQCGLIA